MKWAGGRTGVSDDFATVKDVAPTLLELAGVEQPSTYRGRVAPMQGESWTPFLACDSETIHEEGYEELLASWDDYVRGNGVILPTRDMGYGLVEE